MVLRALHVQGIFERGVIIQLPLSPKKANIFIPEQL